MYGKQCMFPPRRSGGHSLEQPEPDYVDCKGRGWDEYNRRRIEEAANSGLMSGRGPRSTASAKIRSANALEAMPRLDEQLDGVDAWLPHEGNGEIDVQHVAESGAR